MWQNTFNDITADDVNSMSEGIMELLTNPYIKRLFSEHKF